MSIVKQELNFLTSTLMEEVAAYGILEVSLRQYQTVCKKIVTFAHSSGITFYVPNLADRFVLHINNQIKEGYLCPEYGHFQKRVIRMLKTLAETGAVDFSNAKPVVQKYPVQEEVATLVEEILNENNVSETTKLDLRAPMRHLFWYAEKQGYPVGQIGGPAIMKFLIDEVPVTNNGSSGRTLRCVKYVTQYLKKHGNTRLSHDYAMLKLKNAHIRIIPAFSEEEISDISAAVDPNTPVGKRDLAVILLGYGTGLRGADIIRLKLSDIDWRGQCANIVHSKTHQPLILALNGAILNAIADYVLYARPKCKFHRYSSL